MKILGIETSCDETAAAVIKADESAPIRVLSNIVSSQIDIHKKYGGVVPEVAAREHVQNIIPVINEALEKAEIKDLPLSPAKSKQPNTGQSGLDAIAVTVGPGLITSLQIGVETARSLSFAWKTPLVAINHIEGHIYANFINPKFPISPGRAPRGGAGNFQFPSLILTVSGGHTLLLLMTGHGKFKTIGQTRDDAAGEAFDKAAKLMGLGYPGGPAISAKAAKFLNSKSEIRNKSKIQNPNSQNNIILPRPMINTRSFDFSFSGLKTALRYALQSDSDWQNQIPEYCHEFQQAIIDVLIKKTAQAAKEYNAKSIMLTGGVAANNELRLQMAKAIKKDFPGLNFHVPNLQYTSDNAAMIAAAGYYKAIRKEFTSWRKIKTNPNLEL